jgi:hypothetical protein
MSDMTKSQNNDLSEIKWPYTESEVVPEYPGFQTLVDDIMIASGVDENTARNWIVFAADEIREDF